MVAMFSCEKTSSTKLLGVTSSSSSDGDCSGTAPLEMRVIGCINKYFTKWTTEGQCATYRLNRPRRQCSENQVGSSAQNQGEKTFSWYAFFSPNTQQSLYNYILLCILHTSRRKLNSRQYVLYPANSLDQEAHLLPGFGVPGVGPLLYLVNYAGNKWITKGSLGCSIPNTWMEFR